MLLVVVVDITRDLTQDFTRDFSTELIQRNFHARPRTRPYVRPQGILFVTHFLISYSFLIIYIFDICWKQNGKWILLTILCVNDRTSCEDTHCTLLNNSARSANTKGFPIKEIYILFMSSFIIIIEM